MNQLYGGYEFPSMQLRFEEMRKMKKEIIKDIELSKEFFYDEVRDGFYIPGIVKRLWGAGLCILYEIDGICTRHQIPYYVAAGTLLGAVRSGEFIPWDDDIDIMMLRKDYLRFLQVVKKELPEELSIFSLETDSTVSSFVPVVGKRGLESREEMLRKYHEFPYPISVDILILDELSEREEDEEWRKELLKLFLWLPELDAFQKADKKRVRDILQKIETVFNLHFDRKRDLKEQVYRILDTVLQKYNGKGGEYVACVPWYLFENICKYPYSAFEEIKRIPFCGGTVPAPIGYEEVLRASYGDYRKKVKAGGDHNYPCFKNCDKVFRTVLEGKWNFSYRFSEEDLIRDNIVNFRELLFQSLEQLITEEKRIEEDFSEGRLSSCLSTLFVSQETAIAFGNVIEQNKGEGTESVSFLEKYCEALYEAYQSIEGLVSLSPEVQKDIRRKIGKLGHVLKKLRLALKREFKRKVIFLPHRVSHFESLRPLIDELLKSEEIECIIMPIPFYDRLGDGSFSDMHYEGEEFPKEYEITDYRSFNFAEELPDAIVLNSPYDEYNQVWSVDPFFYSKEMKKYTKRLVYIPWFVTDEIDPKCKEDGKAFSNMDYYVTVPGVFHADLTIVQSKEMRKTYLAKIREFTNKEVRKKMRKKISGAGSCLLGEKEGQGVKEVVTEFRRFLNSKHKY